MPTRQVSPYPFLTPLFVTPGYTNVNKRDRVNALGQPDSTKAGLYVSATPRGTIPSGFVGFATALVVDGFQNVGRSEVYNGFVSSEDFFVSLQYVTDQVPPGFRSADLAAVQQEASLIKAQGPYGISASWGMGGFDLPDWLKGLPGLFLLGGTLWLATRKQKNK